MSNEDELYTTINILLLRFVFYDGGEEIEDGGSADAAAAELPNLERRARVGRLHKHARVYVRRLETSPPDKVAVFVDRVDEDILDRSDAGLGVGGDDVLAEADELVAARLARLGLHLKLHLARGRAFLFAVRKHAHTLKFEILAKVDEVAVLLVRLAREAGDEGGAQSEPRDAVAELVEQSHRMLLVRAVHPQQSHVVHVLERNVDVLANLRDFSNGIDELVGEVRRVAVQEADPLDALNLCKRAKQRREVVSLLP
mmetsp:Transcript_19655/g.63859  ORF Transcript_19655/g.63859 Transcript_19655/m.63859 type:complete len:256 (-) Transcript_19655:867-1634(-)